MTELFPRSRTRGSSALGLFLSFVLCSLSFILSSAELPPDQVAFFETNIRPLLVESCHGCHSAESGKSKGSLLLDTRAGLLKGGDSGPAIVPGNPDASLLIKAVRYSMKELQMPPEKNGGPLPKEKVALLEEWVRMGAPDPRTGAAVALTPTSLEAIAAARASHWAFQPVAKPPVPTVRNSSRVSTPVDAFLLAKLEAKGLGFAPVADRRTLLRRVTYDLIGLPPTPAEMDAFLADKSSDAYERVVDRLLATPQHGERWARHWLDVARYSDTKGYVFQEERRYPFSHTYRDYVVNAFNADKPYDRFLIEQLAADKLDLGEDKSALAGMGFLTLGRRFLNREDDIIDDRIDVVTRGTMAMTVGCARCHDHKFDPIPIADYYSLHGIFASSQEPEEKPLLGKITEDADYRDYLVKRAELEAKEEAEVRDEVNKFLATLRAQSGDYLLAAHDAAKDKPAKLDQFATTRKLTPQVLERWMAFLGKPEAAAHPVLAPWFDLAALPAEEFAARAAERIEQWKTSTDAARKLNAKIAQAFANAAPPQSLKDAAAVYNKFFAEVDKAWLAEVQAAGKSNSSSPASLADAASEEARQILYAKDAPANLSDEDVEKLIRRRIRNETVKYRRQIEALNWTHPGAPERAMAMEDRPDPRDTQVYIRGNPGNRGPAAPRQFLAVLAEPERKPFTTGSGRLDLARAIASADNPLTPRVLVNRVWGWYFGRPLVSTPSDFGVRTPAPAQLELLNWLSAQFIEQGWSLKALHRQIVLSSAYRQSSGASANLATLDPDNELIHCFNRSRLDFEETRDTLLAASGRLDLTVGGLPVDFEKEPSSGRRTLYGFIDRQNLPGLYRTFDFANPDASSPGRFATTVPQQALFLMNSGFVLEQARALAARSEIAAAPTDAAKLAAMYRILFQRQPAKDELKIAQQFLASARSSAPAPVVEGGWQYGYGAVLGEGASARVEFQQVKRMRERRYSPGEAYPDAKFHYVAVTPDGGHTGVSPEHCSIRRWVAPADGVIRIEAVLGHGSDKGDGVRGRIVSGAVGVLGEWSAFNSQSPTRFDALKVRAGETLDFVADCRAEHGYDSFTWAPEITLTPDGDASLTRTAWNAAKDFGAKDAPAVAPLEPLARVAQVLLLSNETMFLD